MRPLWKDVLTALWLGILVPGIVLNGFVILDRQPQQLPAATAEAEPVTDREAQITLQDADGSIREMELEAYLTGVVLAEMPAAFQEEALKAQAVAARTYTWKAHTSGGKHETASVCTDPACCQAYLSEEDYLLQGGTEADLEKIRHCVNATASFVLAYGEELIEATYFSSSGGSTESALAVWGADYPYLQAVSSPEEGRVDTVCYSREEFQDLLGVTLSEDPAQWITDVTYTDGGGVAAMGICGEPFTGVQLRDLLKLRSTDFQVSAEDDIITITTKGYGHRVGMSQYGANAMAQQGSTWQQILQHYYPGTAIVSISG